MMGALSSELAGFLLFPWFNSLQGLQQITYYYCYNNPVLNRNLNPPIFLQWRFWAQPPNLIPANISGYTVIIILDLHLIPSRAL